MADLTEVLAARPTRAVNGWCLHYAGFAGPGMKHVEFCRAGVRYRDLAQAQPGELGWTCRCPCTGRSRPDVTPNGCDKMEMPSAEQLSAWKAWTDVRMALTGEAMRLCRAAGPMVGEIECPSCKGWLRYSIAPSNKHLHGHCETNGCLSWMQ